MAIENPPAFPRDCDHFEHKQAGMTLRDWFAGQALPSVIRTCAGDTAASQKGPEAYFAEKAYLLADAMLAARAAVQPSNGG